MKQHQHNMEEELVDEEMEQTSEAAQEETMALMKQFISAVTFAAFLGLVSFSLCHSNETLGHNSWRLADNSQLMKRRNTNTTKKLGTSLK